MTIYLCARLFSWLYGFEWPLMQPTGDGGSVNALLAFLSCFTFPFEIYIVVMLYIGIRRRKNESD